MDTMDSPSSGSAGGPPNKADHNVLHINAKALIVMSVHVSQGNSGTLNVQVQQSRAATEQKAHHETTVHQAKKRSCCEHVAQSKATPKPTPAPTHASTRKFGVLRKTSRTGNVGTYGSPEMDIGSIVYASSGAGACLFLRFWVS